METLLEGFAQNITANVWLAPLLALLAGILASFMPCSLSAIPLIIAYVGGAAEKNGKKAFFYSVMFAAGTAVTFVTMAILAVFAGRMLGTYSRPWLIFLGFLMIAMAFQMWEVVHLVPALDFVSKSKTRGMAGAFLAGILAGIFSSPCSTPVLIALLSIIAVRENMFRGIVLMLFYSVGYSCLALIAGTSVGFVQKLDEDKRYGAFSKIAKAVTGTIILLIGLYMLYLAW